MLYRNHPILGLIAPYFGAIRVMVQHIDQRHQVIAGFFAVFVVLAAESGADELFGQIFVA